MTLKDGRFRSYL